MSEHPFIPYFYAKYIIFFIISSIFYSFLLTPFCVNDIIDSLHPRNRGHDRQLTALSVQTVDKALLLQGFAIVGTAFLI